MAPPVRPGWIGRIPSTTVRTDARHFLWTGAQRANDEYRMQKRQSKRRVDDASKGKTCLSAQAIRGDVADEKTELEGGMGGKKDDLM